jgi:hypothetical protein
MALGSTQPLTEMSTRNLLRGKSGHLFRPTAGNQRLLFTFSNSITENGTIQAKPHNKNSRKILVAMFPTHPLQQRGPLLSTAARRIQSELRMRNLSGISPPTSPTASKRRTYFQLWLLRWRVPFLNNWRKGEITWYMGLWDNAKRVITWMPRGVRGMKKRRIPDRNEKLLSYLNTNIAHILYTVTYMTPISSVKCTAGPRLINRG